jgi:hypothetical protein
MERPFFLFSENLRACGCPCHAIVARGPVSILQSFSHIDYRRVYNGGPITMELSDTVFRNGEALEKVAIQGTNFANRLSIE